MTTPILMLAMMTVPYLAARLLSILTKRDFNTVAAASVGLSVLFAFTGMGHFIRTEPMAEMLPFWIPGRVLLVYLSGGLELAIAAGLALPWTRRVSGYAASILLILFFPVNIYAAVNHAPMGGHAWGPEYLLIRAPLQCAILFWAYWFTIRESKPPTEPAPE